MADDDIDDVWDRIGGAAGDGEAADPAEAEAGPEAQQLPPPLLVTVVLATDTVPVAPWAQGWRIGAVGPQDGLVTLVCQHDQGDHPVAQLSAVAGLLNTIKQAKLEIVQWAIQVYGPIESAPEDLDAELEDLLGGDTDED